MPSMASLAGNPLMIALALAALSGSGIMCLALGLHEIAPKTIAVGASFMVAGSLHLAFGWNLIPRHGDHIALSVTISPNAADGAHANERIEICRDRLISARVNRQFIDTKIREILLILESRFPDQDRKVEELAIKIIMDMENREGGGGNSLETILKKQQSQGPASFEHYVEWEIDYVRDRNISQIALECGVLCTRQYSFGESALEESKIEEGYKKSVTTNSEESRSITVPTNFTLGRANTIPQAARPACGTATPPGEHSVAPSPFAIGNRKGTAAF